MWQRGKEKQGRIQKDSSRAERLSTGKEDGDGMGLGCSLQGRSQQLQQGRKGSGCPFSTEVANPGVVDVNRGEGQGERASEKDGSSTGTRAPCNSRPEESQSLAGRNSGVRYPATAAIRTGYLLRGINAARPVAARTALCLVCARGQDDWFMTREQEPQAGTKPASLAYG